jgi:hypothetical protein
MKPPGERMSAFNSRTQGGPPRVERWPSQVGEEHDFLGGDIRKLAEGVGAKRPGSDEFVAVDADCASVVGRCQSVTK